MWQEYKVVAEEVPSSYRGEGVSCGKAGVRTAIQLCPAD